MHPDSAFDPRGNVLESWELLEPPLRLALCAQAAVYRQIRLWLVAQGVTPRPTSFEDQVHAERWTHCLAITSVPAGLDQFLALMQRVIVLRNLPSTVDDGIALDFYTIPDDLVPSESWVRTDVGELVYTMKYGQSDQLSRETAFETLADRMAGLLPRMPSFERAIVASVPGHDTRHASWSERLAERIGRDTGRRVVRTRARSLIRAQAKEGGVDLRGEFTIESADVANAAVVIVDDVMRRGSTLDAVASAARRAGAPDVHALIAARTIR